MMQDVVETRDTIKDVLINEDKLSMLCLQRHSTASGAKDAESKSACLKEAALLLQSYERQISTIEGVLKVSAIP